MRVLDRAVLAERVMVVERHLERVADRLPASLAGFRPATTGPADLRRFLACLSKHAEE